MPVLRVTNGESENPMNEDPRPAEVVEFGDDEDFGSRELDRSNAEAVGQRLAVALPDASQRKLALAILAAGIRRAHALRPAGWGVTVTTRRGALRLNVGRHVVAVIADGKALWLFGDSRTNPAWSDFVRQSDDTYRTLTGAGYYVTSLTEEAARALTPMFLGRVEAAAVVDVNAQVSGAHTPGFIEYAEAELGEQLPRPDYRSSTRGQQMDERVSAAPRQEISRLGLSEFIPSGLSFPKELVAAYLLGLRTRRFAILTGISGTGKTALAIALARYFETSRGTRPLAEDEAHRIVVGPAQKKYRRFVVPKALSIGWWSAETAPTAVRLKYPGGLSSTSVYSNVAKRVLEVALRPEVLEWFRTLDIGTELKLEAKEEAGTIVELELTPTATSAGTSRHLVLEVRPDWTDSHALLGFFNPVLSAYQRTPLLDLLLGAASDFQRLGAAAPPNFVILDEMNLARVEHYFAELLSCMESDHPLKLHSMSGEDEDSEVPAQLRIPPNVFFTGTVNVDETTHMFSPKVLDRAFVFEFNDVNLSQYGGDGASERPTTLPVKLDFEGWKKPTPADWHRFIESNSPELLLRLHATLERHGRHFGYRVANDVARFVNLAVEGGGVTAAADALDVAIVSKVLPKLVGTQTELESLLVDLFAVASDQPASGAGSVLAGWELSGGALRATAAGGGTPALPRSAAKLFRMLQRLRERGFASFIE